MIIYLVFFVLSFLLIIYSRNLEKRNKKIYLVFELLALLSLCFLASIRSLNVGTDVKTYVYPAFTQTLMSGFNNYFASQIEFGYMLLNYIVCLFSNRISILLFVIQFIIMFFSYNGIKEICKEKTTLGYIVFVLLFYNMSLNIVRQSIAIAFMIYSLKYIFNNKLAKSIVFIFIASLFHKTALIFIIAIIIFKIQNLLKKFDLLIFILCMLLGIVFSFTFDYFLNFLVNIGIVPDQYLFYLEHYVNIKLNFQLIYILTDVILIIIYLLNRKKMNKNDNKYGYFYYFLIMDILFLLIGAKYDVINRIGLYFRLPAYIFYLTNLDLLIKDKNKKIIFNYLVVFFCLLLWYYIFIVGNSGATYPFELRNDLVFYKIFRWWVT